MLSILYNKNGLLANPKRTIRWGKRREKAPCPPPKVLAFNYSYLEEEKKEGKVGKKEKEGEKEKSLKGLSVLKILHAD